MNTAEYNALLLDTASDHDITRLRIEGDSTLVIQRVLGIFATRNNRIQKLQIAAKSELARLQHVTLRHIDRQENGHADRLANAALDRCRTEVKNGVHTDGKVYTSTSTMVPAPAAAPTAAPPPATP
uniref:RNase H type-1 domain-containing protein n=1 Tax=Peronospora matthiolae TaxID=2874970 RepID=A0AAV1TX77_9STRA